MIIDKENKQFILTEEEKASLEDHLLHGGTLHQFMFSISEDDAIVVTLEEGPMAYVYVSPTEDFDHRTGTGKMKIEEAFMILEGEQERLVEDGVCSYTVRGEDERK